MADRLPGTNSFRFQFQDKIVVDGEVTYGLWQAPWFIAHPELLAPDQVVNYRVNSGREGRPDLIAQDAYGNPFLDWVVVAFNKPLDVFNWPKAGQIIRLPALNAVLPFIN